MAYFDFQDLIEKYSTDFIIEIPSDGEWNSKGDYVEGKPKRESMYGAIISHRQNKVFRSEGRLTQQDKALYMLKPIKLALDGAKVIHDNKVYHIESMLDNGGFTGCYAYTLKYVSVFGEVDSNG